MSQKIALVTGANKGLGLEMSRQLAQGGYLVLMGARQAAKGAAAAEQLLAEGLSVRPVELDVTKPEHIANIAQLIATEYGYLDVLMNNAGIMIETTNWASNTATAVSTKDLVQTFDTNFFAVVALTNALLPLLEKSPAGRIVNLSSVLASLTLHSDTNSPTYASKPFAYNASKTALNAYTVHLAAALKGTNVRVNAAHPGWVKTDLGTAAAPMSVRAGVKTALGLIGEDAPNGQFIHLGKVLPW